MTETSFFLWTVIPAAKVHRKIETSKGNGSFNIRLTYVQKKRTSPLRLKGRFSRANKRFDYGFISLSMVMPNP